MATRFSVSQAVKERSTCVISVSFTDESGAAVTPTAVTWTLTDAAGTVINDREDESVTPASEVDIVLKGDDLALPEDTTSLRLLTVEATYNSTYGSGLPLKDCCRFYVENLPSV